jgi:hypothetical protein
MCSTRWGNDKLIQRFDLNAWRDVSGQDPQLSSKIFRKYEAKLTILIN